MITSKDNGILFERKEIIYDRLGNRTEETLIREASREGLVGDKIFTANGFGINTMVVQPCILLVRYNDQNNPVVIDYSDCERISIKRYNIKYNWKGRLSSVKEYLTSPGSQHPEVEMPPFLANSFFSLVSAYSYARKRNINQFLESIFDAPLESETIYRWDSKGNLKSEHKFFFGSLSSSIQYFYGDKNELLQKTRRNEKQSITNDTNIVWKFDKYKNWIEQIISEKDIESPQNTEQSLIRKTRKIKYNTASRSKKLFGNYF